MNKNDDNNEKEYKDTTEIITQAKELGEFL